MVVVAEYIHFTAFKSPLLSAVYLDELFLDITSVDNTVASCFASMRTSCPIGGTLARYRRKDSAMLIG